jgi:hypothetical protein
LRLLHLEQTNRLLLLRVHNPAILRNGNDLLAQRAVDRSE